MKSRDERNLIYDFMTPREKKGRMSYFFIGLELSVVYVSQSTEIR